MSQRPDRAPLGASTPERSMTPAYLAVLIVEAIVLACLWWMTVHFAP